MERVFFIIIVLPIAVYIYFGFRNYMVYKYGKELTHRCYTICRGYTHGIYTPCSDEEFEIHRSNMDANEQMWKSIETAASYDKLLYSLKPLKDKYWLNEKQIKWLSQYEKYAKILQNKNMEEQL